MARVFGPREPFQFGVPQWRVEQLIDEVGEHGLVLSDEQATDLLTAAYTYDMDTFWYRQSPRPKEVRYWLARVMRQAAELRQTLDDLTSGDMLAGGPAYFESEDFEPRAVAAKLLYPHDFTGPRSKRLNPEQLKHDLEKLRREASAAIDSLPADKGVAREDPLFPEFVRFAHDIYKDAGGTAEGVTWGDYLNDDEGGFRGQFFDFVQITLRQVQKDRFDKSDMALGQAIRRALKHRDKPHSN